MADVNQQVLDALNAGYGPEDILAHMHTLAQDSPAHAAWINNLQRQTLDVRSQQNAPDTMPDYTNPNDPRASLELQKNALANPPQNIGNQGLKAPPNALQQFSSDVGNWYQTTPGWQKGLEVGGLAAGAYAAKEGIRRGASILFPTPGEKVAQEQNRISQANLELERQKLAMKSTEAPAGPSEYELARIETEKAKAEQIRASIASQEKRDALAAAKLEQQSKPKLSPFEQQLETLAQQQAQAKAAAASGMQPPPPAIEPTNPKLPALLQPPVNPAAPVAGAAAPVETTPKKAWEPPTASLAVSAPATPTTAPVETTTSPAEAPKAKPAAAEPPPSIESKLGKPTLITGSGMPAYEGQGAEGSKLKHKEGKFASLNDIPKGTVFVPGGNYMDTLRNAVGQQAFTENLKATGGYPASNEATAVQARAINASLNRPTREQAIAQGLSLGEPTPPITKKVGGKKLVSVAGVTGALIALPDLANAAQNQDAASAGRLSNTAGALGLATMMGRAVPAVPPTLPTLGQSIGGRSVNMNPDFLNQLLR